MRKRLVQLNNRLEHIITLNQEHNYTSSFADIKKIEQYYRLLIAIRSKMTSLRLKIRETDTNYNSNLNNSVNRMIKHFSIDINPTTV